MTDFEEFKQYISLADRLYEVMTPDQILECLRMLALHLADYRSRFGEIPKQDLLELVGATELTEEHSKLLRDGMELLVGYLASVRDGWEDEGGPVH